MSKKRAIKQYRTQISCNKCGNTNKLLIRTIQKTKLFGCLVCRNTFTKQSISIMELVINE